MTEIKLNNVRAVRYSHIHADIVLRCADSGKDGKGTFKKFRISVQLEFDILGGFLYLIFTCLYNYVSVNHHRI